MEKYRLQLQAALMPQSPLYVTRDAEVEVLAELRSENPSFLLISEPRQQGKTSFINYLLGHAGLAHCCFVSINAGPINRNTSEEDWYHLFSQEIARQLNVHTFFGDKLTHYATHGEWREQLISLSQIAFQHNCVIVIAIDEIGHLPASWRESFLAATCALRDSRGSISSLNAITFLFVGSFRPDAMITDGNISPFNKARPIELRDFTNAQVANLLQRIGADDDLIKELLPRLYYWTDGQPYLVQQLAYLVLKQSPSSITVETVDKQAYQLERTDKLLLPTIFSRLRTNRQWLKKAEQILNGEKIEFAPASLVWQAELATLGLIKEEQSTANCVIRNPIYARALRRLLLALKEASDEPDSRNQIRHHLNELLIEHRRRKEQLEIRKARFGINTPAEVVIEIEDIDKQVASCVEQLVVLS